MTHTFVVVHVSDDCFHEIKMALEAADYHHCLIEDLNGLVLDLNGIALQRKSDFHHLKNNSDRRIEA